MIELHLIENVEKTKCVISIDLETLEVDLLDIYLIESGEGVEHELIESDLISIVMKIHRDVINYS